MGDGSSPREAARERVVRCRSHDLPTLISSENLALPPEPTRPHHAGTTPHRRRRPPSSPAVKTKCCAPPPPLRPPPQWNRPPPPPSTRHGRHQRWRDAVPCCAPAPRCITWAGWPREPAPAGQTPVPACDWWRAAIQGAHGDDQACQRAREDCSGGPPPYWEASVSSTPPAAGHHAPQKLSASRPAPDLFRLLGRLACHTPCPFGTKTELESNSQTRHQRVCARVGFDLTITIIEGRQIVPCLQSDNGRARVC